MSKIMVLTAFHGIGGHRKEICTFFSRRMSAVRKATGIETMIVGSECELSKQIADEYGHHYIEFQNKPLSRKFNAGLEACREHYPTHVMILGSDDIVSTSLFESYIAFLKNREYDIIGIKDLYFLSLHHKRWGFGHCGYWKGRQSALGVARCYSKRVLDYCNWNLWSDDRNARMDSGAMETVTKLKKEGNKISSITLKITDGSHFLMDIKTCGNISSMQSFRLQPMDYKDLFHRFLPMDEANDLIEYCNFMIDYYGKK